MRSAPRTASSTWRLTFWSRSLPRRQPAAGVDEQERPAQPLGLDDLAVAGHARMVLDDRHPLPDRAIDERRLADVRSSDDGDHGQSGHAATPTVSARRNAMPSVGTTSTARGRSAGVVPSRNRPSDRHTSGSRYRWPSGSRPARERGPHPPSGRPRRCCHRRTRCPPRSRARRPDPASPRSGRSTSAP